MSLVLSPDCEEALWTYSSPGGSLAIAAPVAEIDGKSVTLSAKLSLAHTANASSLLQETTYTGQVVGHPDLTLSLVVRSAKETPVLRFRYELKASTSRLLTKTDGREHFDLAQLSVAEGLTEIRLSDYNSFIHSYVPTEYTLTTADFASSRTCMGPLMVWPTENGHAFIAYEHGSQYPDAYLAFYAAQSGHDRTITLSSVKATYLSNHDLRQGFESVWMEIGAVPGDRSEIEKAFRNFIQYYQALSFESRKPYVFYNTWNLQSRLYVWEDRPYLDCMNEARMLAEIEAAHKLNIEVFVLDTGWYGATGDWAVSEERFPNGLKPLTDLLDKYGMKLGLWFGPTTAALSSNLYKRNVKNRVSWEGELAPTRMIWETEESAEFCLASSYAEDFAQELIRCAREFGVRYFKWDAINQYECDDPNHDHGDSSHTREERADRYAFLQPLQLVKIVNILCAEFPDAIVDFDVTEYDRCFGLAFLSAGKYFLTNNASYIWNFDVPTDKDVKFKNNCIFFYPGPARDWACRMPYHFDRWIPSTLMLVHYLPDDGPENQNMAAGSLILGHNGIWGDLLGISESGKKHLGALLAPYAKVRDDAASVCYHQTGSVGTMVETYEKINPTTGRGLMVIFGNVSIRDCRGRPSILRFPFEPTVTTKSTPNQQIWHTDNVKVRFDSEGHAQLEARFTTCDAAIVYFGV